MPGTRSWSQNSGLVIDWFLGRWSVKGKVLLFDIDVASEEPIAEAEVDDRKPKQIYNLAFSSDGSMIAAGGEALDVTLWSVPDLDPIAEKRIHDRMVVDLDFSPLTGDALFASASHDIESTVGLFQIVKQQLQVQLEEPSEGSKVIGVRTSQDGSPQAVRLEAEDTRVGGYTLNQVLQSYAISSSGSLLALGYEDGSIEILDLETDSAVGNFHFIEESVLALAFINDRELAFGYCEVPGGENTARKPLCNLNYFGRLDIQTGNIEKVDQEHTDFVRALAYDPNNDVLASGGEGRSIEFQDLKNDQPFGSTISDLKEVVNIMAFSPDGSLLAYTSDDQTLNLWDMSATPKRQIGEPFTGFSGFITSLVFAPDGLSLHTGLDDGSLLSWDIDPLSWVELNCELAGRNLTELEWNTIYPEEPYNESCS